MNAQEKAPNVQGKAVNTQGKAVNTQGKAANTQGKAVIGRANLRRRRDPIRRAVVGEVLPRTAGFRGVLLCLRVAACDDEVDL